MLIRRMLTYAALAIVALAGLGVIWAGNLLPLKAGLATPGTPKAMLQVASSPPRILFESHAGNPAETALEYQRYLKTQMALMRSRFVMNSALQHDGISRLPLLKSQADPIDWLENNREVSNIADTELVEVSLPPRSGLSHKEQASVINAVVGAYIDEVANKYRRLMLQRQETLKRLSKSYSEMIKTRRDTIRKLAHTDFPPAQVLLWDASRADLPRQYHDLEARNVELKMVRAEAEAMLLRGKKSEARSGEQGRKEIAQLEDRVAALDARRKVLDREVDLLAKQMQSASQRVEMLDLSEYQDDLKQIQHAADKVGAALEELNIELQAPPRVTLVERAEAE